MRELIRADWYRAGKSRLYVLLLAEAAVVLLILMIAIDGRSPGDRLGLSPGVPGSYVLISAMVSAVVYGVSMEQDYAQGIIRNKLVSGHTRASAYWASYVVNTLIAYLVAAVYLALMLGTGLAWTEYDFREMVLYLAQGLGAVAAFTALYSLIGAVWTRRGTAVACLIAVFMLVVTSNLISNALAEPEFYDPETIMIMQLEGDIAAGTDLMANPGYVAEPTRSVYEFLSSFLPSGQAVQMIDGAGENLPLYALGFCGLCWTSALLVLRRRNLQ